MLSRENRIILGSLLLFVGVIVTLLPLEDALGTAVLEQPLVAFLLFTGLIVAVPQLYLAATDDDVSPRTRVRFTVIVTGIFAVMFAEPAALEGSLGLSLFTDLEALQHALIVAIGVGAFVGLVWYEFLAGYRSSGDDATARP